MVTKVSTVAPGDRASSQFCLQDRWRPSRDTTEGPSHCDQRDIIWMYSREMYTARSFQYWNQNLLLSLLQHHKTWQGGSKKQGPGLGWGQRRQGSWGQPGVQHPWSAAIPATVAGSAGLLHLAGEHLCFTTHSMTVTSI